MLPYEKMPEDNRELAHVEVSFPRLDQNDASTCPVPMSDVLSYLRMESVDGDEVSESQLTFLRTAQVAEKGYWIWRFLESDGTKYYVTVSVNAAGAVYLGMAEDYGGWTPEQFMLGDYHGVF